MNCSCRTNTSHNWLDHGVVTKKTPAVTDVIVDGENIITFKDDGTSQELNVPVLGAKTLRILNTSGKVHIATVYTP